MKLLIHFAIHVISLLVVAYVIPGFILSDLWSAVVAAIAIGVVNTFIKPILHIIALPITLVTFGVAAFLLNVLLLWLTSFVVPGFEIDSFLTAVIASVVLSLVSWFLHRLARD